MPNRFLGTCSCGVKVPPSAGFCLRGGDGRWLVRCRSCGARSSAPVASTVEESATGHGHLVRLSAAGALVAVKPDGFLGPRAFEAFRAAYGAAGAIYDAVEKRVTAGLEAAPRLRDAFGALGFKVEVHPDLAAAVQARAAALRADAVAASGRAAEVAATLAARGLALFPFQGVGVTWLATRLAALLADEMGLGKTVQAAAAIADGAPVVVVAPAIAKGVWRRELSRWRGDLRVEVLAGRGSFRWPRPCEVVVTNYDVMPKTRDEDADGDALAAVSGDLLDPRPISATPAPGTHLIFDEAHNLKNPNAKRTKRAWQLADDVRAVVGGRVWGLTATPLLNEPGELWCLFGVLGLRGETFGSWKRFAAAFGGVKGSYGWTWGRTKDVVPDTLRRVMLRRLRVEVLPDLPSYTYQEISVDLDASTKRLCDLALEALEAAGLTLEGALERGDAAKADSRAGAVAFERMSAARCALATAKIGAAVELVEEFEAAGEPLVVFSAHRAPVDALAARDGWGMVAGGVANDDRTKVEEAFQRGELRGVAATIQAGGVAITLTRAANAIFVDEAWTPALNAQARDRIVRIGQTRGCVIRRLVAAHPLDERIAELLAQKQKLIDDSIERATTSAPVAGAVLVDPRLADLEKFEATPVSAPAESRLRTLPGEYPFAPAAPPRPTRAPASDAVQRWAAAGLLTLAGLDGDRAKLRNDVGFNGSDGDFGHALAGRLQEAGGLTDREWAAAVRLLTKYHGQIGKVPTLDDEGDLF